MSAAILKTKKPSTAFSQSFLDEMGSMLVAEEKRLKDELAVFSKRNDHDAEDYDAKFPEYGDELDANAHEIEEYTVNKPLEMTLENALRDVKKALEAMDKGKYGMCKYCGKPIEEKRLRARPTSSSCVECKKTIMSEA